MKNIISSEDLKSRDGRRKTSRVRAVTVNAERRRAFPPPVGSLGAPADPSACGRRDQAGAAAILNVCCVSPSAAARIKGPRLVPPRPVSTFLPIRAGGGVCEPAATRRRTAGGLRGGTLTTPPGAVEPGTRLSAGGVRG